MPQSWVSWAVLEPVGIVWGGSGTIPLRFRDQWGGGTDPTPPLHPTPRTPLGGQQGGLGVMLAPKMAAKFKTYRKNTHPKTTPKGKRFHSSFLMDPMSKISNWEDHKGSI